jgi:hypothetical protein
MKPFLAVALGLPFAALFAGNAAASPHDACRRQSTLSHISQDFRDRAATYLQTDAEIFEIRDMRMNRYEPRTKDISSVEREYCHATVSLTDGRRRDLWYVVQWGWGFAGSGYKIEYCISGLDPAHVYGADCRSLR